MAARVPSDGRGVEGPSLGEIAPSCGLPAPGWRATSVLANHVLELTKLRQSCLPTHLQAGPVVVLPKFCGTMADMHRAFCVLALCLLLACDETQTVEIRICSDAVIPPAGADYVVADGEVVEVTTDAAVGDDADRDLTVELDTVRILLRDADYEEIASAGRELASGTTLPRAGFDMRVDFPVRSAARYVEVIGLLGGGQVGHFVRSVPKLDEVDRLTMPLREECYGIRCGAGQACVDGSCTVAPGPTGGDSCRGVGP